VHQELIGRLKPEDRGLKRREYYVLRNTKPPAILVECGFLSNTWERARCLEPSYRQLVAQSIGDGVLKYCIDQKRGAAR
jgi:N-acetylmuramoyl-L-alanine amidase